MFPYHKKNVPIYPYPWVKQSSVGFNLQAPFRFVHSLISDVSSQSIFHCERESACNIVFVAWVAGAIECPLHPSLSVTYGYWTSDRQSVCPPDWRRSSAVGRLVDLMSKFLKPQVMRGNEEFTTYFLYPLPSSKQQRVFQDQIVL